MLINPVISTPYIVLFLFLVDIAIVIFIIFNIYQLLPCECFTKNDNKVVEELKYMIYIEIIIFITYILNFFEVWRLTQMSIEEVVMVKNAKAILVFFLTVMSVAYLYLHFFLISVNEKVDYSCSCFRVEIKYAIYFQILIFSFSYCVLLHQIFVQWLKTKMCD